MADNPKSRDEYEQGGGSLRGSIGSLDEAHLDVDTEHGHLLPPGRRDDDSTQGLRRRRSSMAMRVNALTQYGGVNSIENFARSWQRAVAFHDITPVRASFALVDDSQPGSPRMEPSSVGEERSHLRQQLVGSRQPSMSAVSDEEQLSPAAIPIGRSRSYSRDYFVPSAHNASPFSSGYGAMWDTGKAAETGRDTAARLFNEQQDTGTQDPDRDRQPLLLKRVEDEEGHPGIEVIGQSTIYQTILNSTNVLLGVGLLSLPLGLMYTGWAVGLTFLTLSAVVTAYTANLLGKCLEVDTNMITFSDIAYAAFGYRAQILIAVTFTFELLAACVAMVILFADCLNLLIPGWGLLGFKLLCGLIMIPLSFIPLRFLGYTSSLGIFCNLIIVVVLIIDGIIKPEYPGSFRDPAATYLFPEKWSTLPLGLGLLMSPWGGHAVFPNIYRDMRHPHKYTQSLKVTFGFTYLLDASTAIAGYVMFGELTREEITQNIFLTEGFPKVLSITTAICIAIIPITKLPLNFRPILTTMEHLAGLRTQEFTGMSSLYRGLLRAGVRISVVVVIIVIAIICPSFDRVVALVGSAFCFTICVVVPVLFYLRIHGNNISRGEKILDYFLVVVCSILAVVGTTWAFLPASLTGVREGRGI